MGNGSIKCVVLSVIDKYNFTVMNADDLNTAIDKLVSSGKKVVVDDRISMQSRLSEHFVSSSAGLKKGVDYILGDTSCLPVILLTDKSNDTINDLNANSVYINNLGIVSQ